MSPADDLYNYDFPIPSNSSLMSIPQRALRTRRSPSPPSRSYHTPHFPTTKYTPSTRQAEVSRLLDPSYSNIQQGSSSSKTNSPLSVFVDHHGDIHDPDYRDFPALPTRPKWESNDAAEDDKAYNKPRRPSFETYAYRPHYTYYHYESPSPTSFASELDESPFDDDHAPVERSEKNKLSKKYRGVRHSPVEEKQVLAGTDEQPPPADTTTEHSGHDWTPTCTESIRREWQAITLSLRFSVFRTKRRLRRRLGTG